MISIIWNTVLLLIYILALTYVNIRFVIWWDNSSLAKQIKEDILAVKRMLQKKPSELDDKLVGVHHETSWWDNLVQDVLKHFDRAEAKYKEKK